jgi:hypothetical protein
MAALSNHKHELFAQALAKGETADAAYVMAGYKENRGNAATLKANQNIADRVAELLDLSKLRAELGIKGKRGAREEDQDRMNAKSVTGTATARGDVACRPLVVTWEPA